VLKLDARNDSCLMLHISLCVKSSGMLNSAVIRAFGYAFVDLFCLIDAF